ncbi:MAG: hypothetical protein AVDCRST_MAG96-1973 [uncultured Segetibacter sp.]|uniref:Uncharacterized protein n=1 Tax=uncultured Segetibacter sp. TaxID=481133 RepID=A0A6J4SKG6_9BACT|nr:MAG: hypothetical protein AVDCRST_MAG96-1973 [uncultured Segetibacter sp.]
MSLFLPFASSKVCCVGLLKMRNTKTTKRSAKTTKRSASTKEQQFQI